MAKKILIVDDEQDILKALGIRLKASGYETVFATDGYSATKMAQNEKPDLILLDLGLPAGDGYAVLERMKNIFALSIIPIIVLSARDPESNRERSMNAGAIAYFRKPADNDELLATIQQALSTYSTSVPGE